MAAPTERLRALAAAHHSLTRRYGLAKAVRRAKVLAVEPVFAADDDAAAHLRAGCPPRMPTAFRLALDDGSTLTAKRVVAAVCRTLLHVGCCMLDQCSVDRRMLQVAPVASKDTSAEAHSWCERCTYIVTKCATVSCAAALAPVTSSALIGTVREKWLQCSRTGE